MKAPPTQGMLDSQIEELACIGKACSPLRSGQGWKHIRDAGGLAMLPSSALRSKPGLCAGHRPTHLRCEDMAPGARCRTDAYGRRHQLCTDLPELRSAASAVVEPAQNISRRWAAYRGSVLHPEHTWRWESKKRVRIKCKASACSAHSSRVSVVDFLNFTEMAGAGSNRMDQPRQGFVPTLLREVHAHGAAPRISQMPCSANARMEDAVILRSFFVDARGWPLRAPGSTFLEIGAYNGMDETTTWFFEACLGWRGILIEAHPASFDVLKEARPRTLNMRLAACAEWGFVSFPAAGGTTARHAASTRRGNAGGVDQTTPRRAASPSPPSSLRVRCGPLGEYLTLLGVSRLDFVSLDVEGSEEVVVASVLRSGISLGVLMVEVRGDGQRPRLVSTLTNARLTYTGQIYARPSSQNEVVSDVWVNLSHMAAFYPLSCALNVSGCGGSATGGSSFQALKR